MYYWYDGKTRAAGRGMRGKKEPRQGGRGEQNEPYFNEVVSVLHIAILQVVYWTAIVAQ